MKRILPLMFEVAQVEAELEWREGKLVMKTERLEVWKERLARTPNALRPLIKTELIAVATKIMRITDNAPAIEPALKQLMILAALVAMSAAQPATRKAPLTGHGLRAPREGAKAVPGTFTVGSVIGVGRSADMSSELARRASR